MDRSLQRRHHDGLRGIGPERGRELHLSLPRLGLGLRSAHLEQILASAPPVGFFEAISENFMDSGGWPRAALRRVAERYPVVLHGVSMNLGSLDPLRRPYLRRLRALADEVGARLVSDHLCFTGVMGWNSHDLLPLPLTEESLRHLIGRVKEAQEQLERPLAIENPSTYLRFAGDTLREPDFLRALCDETGCALLLDVNNVYVSATNAGEDPVSWLLGFPFERVVQLHLAGHQRQGDHLIDTHDQPVCRPVWELFRLAWSRTEGAGALLEWDGAVPPFDVVWAEAERALGYMEGPVDLALARSASDLPSGSASSLSTPLHHLVSPVMRGAALAVP